MKESEFQKKIKDKIKSMLPGCLILKNDPTYLQGVPDLLILFKYKWAALEVKVSNKANIQPNQKYYVEKLGKSGYAAFINPENEEEILHDLRNYMESD